MAIFRYCIHREDTDEEVAIAVSDLDRFLHERIAAYILGVPLHRRLREETIRGAVDAALNEVLEVARAKTVRL
jgi:hypothetical protein